MNTFDPTISFVPLSTHNITLPDHLVVRTTQTNLLQQCHTSGQNVEVFFGMAFIQGRRLQFTTAMPVETMLKVSKIDQAKGGSTVSEMRSKGNRPKIAGHAKALRQYFKDTACKGEKFILPAFAFNFGDEHTTPEDAPNATLWIYTEYDEEEITAWPAMLQLPRAIKLDTTDGGHRCGEIAYILSDKSSFTEEERDNLSQNSCDVKIIFERKRVDAHQDFADCAKAKPITGSIIATFDVRDERNRRAVTLNESVPFLKENVDATAANVNLSSASVKIWSMSALRGFVGHIQDHYPPSTVEGKDVVQELAEKMDGAEVFFEALIRHIPPFHALELKRLETKKTEGVPISAATYRNKLGGNILFRGVAMSLFARAFIYCKENRMIYEEMARKLAAVNWNVLDCERSELPDTSTLEGRERFPEAVRAHLNPIWASMVVIGESRYRIASANQEVNHAWASILDEHVTECLPVAPRRRRAAAAE